MPTIAPDQVSEYPKTCANAGDSVFTGSEPKPTHITISSDIASCGSARTRPMLSRSDARIAKTCWRGFTASSPATSARYESELRANAQGMPSVAITPAALAGPIARARLKVIELRATAWATSLASTSEVISAC